jgi:protein SCO1/2
VNRIAIVTLLLASLIAGCRGTDASGVSTAVPSASAAEDVVAAPRSDLSIYALSMTLTDQDDRKVGLDVFRGKPVFIGMFYGSCPSACPLLISTIRRAMSELDTSSGSEVRVLLVSFDPEHDTPRALRAIFAQRGLDARWKLAAAPDDQVRDLAALLGIQYRKLPDGSYNHTSSVVLLDRTGAIDMRIDDTSQPIELLVERARALAAQGRY